MDLLKELNKIKKEIQKTEGIIRYKKNNKPSEYDLFHINQLNLKYVEIVKAINDSKPINVDQKKLGSKGLDSNEKTSPNGMENTGIKSYAKVTAPIVTPNLTRKLELLTPESSPSTIPSTISSTISSTIPSTIPSTISSTTSLQSIKYPCYGTDLSQIKFLDAIAQKISLVYDFQPIQPIPTMQDVLNSITNNNWLFRKNKSNHFENKPLTDLFTFEEWNLIKMMHHRSHLSIHNARLSKTSKGDVFILMPFSDMETNTIMKSIAHVSGMVNDSSQFLIITNDVIDNEIQLQIQLQRITFESSMIKFLDSIAQSLSIHYEFETQSIHPNMNDVFNSIKNSCCEKRYIDSKNIVDYFSVEQWRFIHEKYCWINTCMGDGKMVVNEWGNPFVYLYHDEYVEKNLGYIKRMAEVCGWNDLVIIDEILFNKQN